MTDFSHICTAEDYRRHMTTLRMTHKDLDEDTLIRCSHSLLLGLFLKDPSRSPSSPPKVDWAKMAELLGQEVAAVLKIQQEPPLGDTGVML